MTLKEVAELAGVSPSAVSRYLNGGPLSEDKSVRIRQAIEQTGYRPNAVAQTLRTGKLRQVGVIVPKIHSVSVSQVTAGIESVLSARGYLTMLGCSGGDDLQELRYLEMMQSNHVAGIILMGTTLTPAKADAFRSCRVPLVITGQNFPGLPCVYHDDFDAAKELAARLIQRGRRRLVYLGVDERDAAVGLARRKGVQAALREAGLDGQQLPRSAGDFTPDSGAAEMRRLLEQHPDLDGVICATDAIAHGAMLALRAAGRRLPEDVSIAGFGNSWFNEFSQPRLTTARLFQEECGRDAAGILLQMLEHDAPGSPVRKVALGYSIVERGSV